ncbi:DinB family protein [Micromonospora sp. NPDC050187]|uniref:DinB family protein n=1 Tax=Micromonospora sp. NPDC050187 TaxID=3364277 RepID=UPI003795C263
MTWTAPAVDRKPDPMLGDETAVLAGWLDYHRDTLLLKCSGLTEAQLKTNSVPVTNLTLLGLVRHMTELERWLRTLFTGETAEDPYSTEERPDAAFDDVATADVQADFDLFRQEAELTRKAFTLRDLGETYEDEGEVRNLRTTVVHILEEYARHNGHADLIRQSIDGATGD